LIRTPCFTTCIINTNTHHIFTKNITALSNHLDIRTNVIYNTIKELGFDDFTICINNRKILNGLFSSLDLTAISADVMRIIDKLEKIGLDNVISELKKLEISDEKISKIVEFINIKGTTDEKISSLNNLGISDELFAQGLNELTQVINAIRLFRIPESNFTVDLTIARGLDYYTGTVYETFLNEYRQLGSVCSGGRYDNLAEYYTNKKLPGVGVSIGLTRLFYKLNELNAISADKKSITDVLIISADNDLSACMPIATEFRNANINTELYMNNRKIKAKFKYADKLNIPFVVTIGEDEIKTNTVSLKNMQTGEQQSCSIEEAINIVRK